MRAPGKKHAGAGENEIAMQVIEAALAFAVTMLVLSMVSSTLVEMIHRTFGMREKGLHFMLGQLFDQVLIHYATHASGPLIVRTSVDALRTEFQKTMTSNRAPVALAAQPAQPAPEPPPQLEKPTQLAALWRAIVDQWRRFWNSWAFGDLWSGNKLSTLSLESFMQRLGSNEIGDKIVHAASQDADTVLRDIAQKFEEYGKDASTYFERRARFLSVMVAIFVAFALHVDAIDLFRTFLRDPAVRAAVIDKQQEIVKAIEEAQNNVTKADPNSLSGKEAIDQWKQAIGVMGQTKTLLGDFSVPLGWTEERVKSGAMAAIVWKCVDGRPRFIDWFGNCEPKLAQQVWVQVPTVPSLYLGLLLGGLLIGLGGPFWRDAVTNLTSIRSIARAVQPPPAETAPHPAAPATPKEVAQPSTPVAVFKVANGARASLQNGGGPDRPLLNQDGTRGLP